MVGSLIPVPKYLLLKVNLIIHFHVKLSLSSGNYSYRENWLRIGTMHAIQQEQLKLRLVKMSTIKRQKGFCNVMGMRV